MRALWRISTHKDLDGLGGEKTDGRWHTMRRGKRIVYLSEHPALALIEVLVNLRGNPNFMPDAYQLMKVIVADGVAADAIEPSMLTPNWRENNKETQMFGDEWLESSSTALLSVPSAPSPESTNYLFNPHHPGAKNVTIEWCRWIEYDRRLFDIHEDH